LKEKIDLKKITIKKLAGLISQTLNEHGIDSILVGGACVSIYSENRYQSYDLDFVTYEDEKKVAKALGVLNFQKKGKYFSNPHCAFIIEFVAPPVSVGDEPIHHFEYRETPLGVIKMLTPTDSVKDRLASFYHWDDTQSLSQAIAVCREQDINMREIKRWSKKEGYAEKFEQFQAEVVRNERS